MGVDQGRGSAVPQQSGREQQGAFVAEGLWGERAWGSKEDEWGTGGGVAGLQVDPCKQFERSHLVSSADLADPDSRSSFPTVGGPESGSPMYDPLCHERGVFEQAVRSVRNRSGGSASRLYLCATSAPQNAPPLHHFPRHALTASRSATGWE